MVSLKVYDILGREVAELVNTVKEAGRYKIVFEAGNLTSGIYIVQLKVNDYSQQSKISLMK